MRVPWIAAARRLPPPAERGAALSGAALSASNRAQQLGNLIAVASRIILQLLNENLKN